MSHSPNLPPAESGQPATDREAARLVGGYTTASTAGALKRLLEQLPEHTPVVLVDPLSPGGGLWLAAETRLDQRGKLLVALDLTSPVSPEQLQL